MVAEFEGKPSLSRAGPGGHDPDRERPIATQPFPEVGKYPLSANERHRERIGREELRFSWDLLAGRRNSPAEVPLQGQTRRGRKMEEAGEQVWVPMHPLTQSG